MKRGLVLGGGGSLGSYEIGAYEALKELGYSFDVITGTSIGAINGAFATYDSIEDAKKLWLHISANQVMTNGINLNKELLQISDYSKLTDIKNFFGNYLQRKFSVDISPFKKILKENLNLDKAISSKRQYGIVTTKYPSMVLQEVNMKNVEKRNFLSFIHASSAVIPLFPIEVIDNEKYIDGGFSDNVPIDFAFRLGADEVFAIDLKIFNLKPKNSFYLSLPNVHYIAPYINLGSMMDFNQDVIRKNMDLGYLDTMKYFKKIRGFFFAFKGEIKSDGFIPDIIHQFGANSEKFFLKLKNGIRGQLDETDLFVRTIELILQKIKFEDYYRSYTIKDIAAIIEEKTTVNKFNFKYLLKTPLRTLKKLNPSDEPSFDDILIYFCKKYLNINSQISFD